MTEHALSVRLITAPLSPDGETDPAGTVRAAFRRLDELIAEAPEAWGQLLAPLPEGEPMAEALAARVQAVGPELPGELRNFHADLTAESCIYKQNPNPPPYEICFHDFPTSATIDGEGRGFRLHLEVPCTACV